MSTIPTDLFYTAAHEYVRFGAGGVAAIGITDYAQSALGDIIYIELPKVGAALTTSAVCGTVKAVKAVSQLFSPVTGEVIAVNEQLAGDLALVNLDPYGAGWMLRVRVGNPAARDGLLTPAEYAQQLAQ